MDRPESPEELVDELTKCGERLPKGLERRILALGTAVVPALIRILDDEELAESAAPGGGYAPIHAADLLAELRAPEAVEPMLRALSRTDFMDVLHDRLLQDLPAIGAPVLEPGLRVVAEARGDLRESVLAVLADAGVHDNRVLELLLEELRRDPERAANLAEYGDPRALPELYRAFDSFRLERDESPFANQALVEIRDAIEELGGSLTPEQEAKFRRGQEPAEEFRRRLFSLAETEQNDGLIAGPPARADRPGRNDPCWCGSGKKYKRCHLDADEGRGPAAPGRDR